MKVNRAASSLLLAGAFVALPSCARAAQPAGHVSGEYIESRTADVYTGPCFANSEVNLTGQEAVLGWHVDKGTWRSEEHTSELQSHSELVCRLLLEKKK